MAENRVREDKSERRVGIVTSPEACCRPSPKHQVMDRSCHFHNQQVIDLYCLKCDQPMCQTCSTSTHGGHKRCDLVKQAESCKAKLEDIREDTDGLIKVVKQAVTETTSQVMQAQADIDDACDNAKSAFKVMHSQLEDEENTVLSSLQEARKRVEKAANYSMDSQMMYLASLESLKSCQVKLADEDNVYDYVTDTDAMKKDVEHQFSKKITDVKWTSEFVNKNKPRHQSCVDLVQSVVTKNIKVTGSVASNKQVEVKEVGRIRLHAQDRGSVLGMVVHHERVYVVHHIGLTVYCYAPDGSLSHIYEHPAGSSVTVYGMCLVIDGDKAMLMVSDYNGQSLVWITIRDQVTMEHYKIQQLDYRPCGAYDDRGELMICDADNHKIHRYRHDGQKLAVIKLPDDVMPRWIARHGGDGQYVVTDCSNHQIVIVDRKAQVKTRYKDKIQGVVVGGPRDVITGPHSGVLIANYHHNQVLLLRRTGDVVTILDQHVISPDILYLDTDSQRLYVSGTDQLKERHVSIFDYTKELYVKITMLDMKVEI